MTDRTRLRHRLSCDQPLCHARWARASSILAVNTTLDGVGHPTLSEVDISIFLFHKSKVSLYSLSFVQHERPQEDTGQFISPTSCYRRFRTAVPQLRSKSQDSTSSKNKEPKPSATAIANASPPPPPPNSAKPLPQPSSAVASLNHVNSSSHSLSSANGSVSRASTAALSSQGGDRRYGGADRASTAPPIVVVSPEAPADAQERQPFVVESSGGPTTPPRANLNRLRPTGPKDTIPMVGKPPRKQRSSRFVVTERVEIERLPPFMGM